MSEKFKQKKNNKFKNNKSFKSSKVKLSFKRRLDLYYSRFLFVMKITLVILPILFFFTNFFAGSKEQLKQQIYKITANNGFVLDKVIIQGQSNVSSSDIVKAIKARNGSPIFAIELEEIKKRLDNNPWIRTSIVERRLPDSLYIAIFERQPMAIWQFNKKLYLIDSDGKRITNKNIENFSDLLHIVGDEANLYAKTLMNDLAQYPDIADKVKSATRYGNRRWDLILQENILVKMPESNFNIAYKYLHELNKNKKLFANRYKSLDLRGKDKYFFEKYE